MDPTIFTADAPGRLVDCNGHRAFVPAPLPPALEFTPELVTVLSRADSSVACSPAPAGT